MPKINFLSAITAVLLCVPGSVLAQGKGATYITKEQVDVVNKQPGTDRTIQVLDIGHENFAVGIIQRGPTGGGGGAAGGGGGAAGGGAGRGGAAAGGGGAARGGAAPPPAEPCGQAATTPPPAGTPNGLYHDSQT